MLHPNMFNHKHLKNIIKLRNMLKKSILARMLLIPKCSNWWEETMKDLIKKAKEAFAEVRRDFEEYLFIVNFARKHR